VDGCAEHAIGDKGDRQLKQQVNPLVFSIISFECLFGTGTMEWIPVWLRGLHTNVWISFAAYALLSTAFAYLVLRSAQRLSGGFSGCTMLDLYLGKRVGGVLNLCLAGAFIVCSARTLSLCAWLMHYAALPYTPGIALILLCLLTPVQLLHGGMDALFRFQTALYWPTLILALLLLCVSFKDADFANLLPVTASVHASVMQVISRTLDLLPGITLIMVYLPVFIQLGITSRQSLINYLWASAGVIALNMLNLVIVLSVLGPFEGASLQWPILEIVRIQKMTGPLLERLDLIFFLTVIICMISAVNLSMYGAYRIFVHYVHPRSLHTMVWAIVALVLFAVIPDDFDSLDRVYAYVFRFFEFVTFGLLLAIWLRGRVHTRDGRDTA
jgi:hypothetical protein